MTAGRAAPATASEDLPLRGAALAPAQESDYRATLGAALGVRFPRDEVERAEPYRVGVVLAIVVCAREGLFWRRFITHWRAAKTGG